MTPEDDPDLLAALLANAREERDDTHQQLIESQDWINTMLANPLYRGLRRTAHMVGLRRGEVERPAPESPPTMADHATEPIDPGALLVDATALTESMRSGIARVTIRVFTELSRSTATQLVLPTPGGLRRAVGLENAVLEGLSIDRNRQPANPGLFSAGVVPGPFAEDWWRSVDSYRRGGGTYAQVVHDLLPITMPEFFDRNLRTYFPQWLAQVLQRADVVFTDSAATLADLQLWSATHGCVPGQLKQVLPLGSDLPQQPATPAEPSRGAGRQVLVVGTIEPRKGVEAVLDAVEYLRENDPDVTVVFCGARGWIAPSGLRRLQEAAADDPQVRWESSVDDKRLAELYAESDLLLAPSRGEGFGLPILEAQANGLAVLARNIDVFREIAGDSVAYFDSDTDLGPAILATLDNPPAPRPMRQLPTWADSAAAVLSGIDRARKAPASGDPE